MTEAAPAFGGEITAAVRGYQRAVDALDEMAARLMGLNRTDARVLDLLEEHGRMTAGEVASGAVLTSGAVTGVIDRLERAGYVRRIRDDHDRRRVIVEPTAAVYEVARDLYYGLGVRGAEIMRGYSANDLSLVARFLRDATTLTEEHIEDLKRRPDPPARS